MKQPLGMLTCVLVTGFIAVGCSQNNGVSFHQDVVPIIKDHCIECHSVGGKGYKESGLDMASYNGLMRGTKFGPIIVQGDSTSSTLMEEDKIKVYPNPVSDLLNIEGLEPGTRIELFDIDGKKILERSVTSDQVLIHVGQLMDGFYYLVIRSKEDLQKETRKVIKTSGR